MRKLLFLAFLSIWLALPVLAQTSQDGFTNCDTPAADAVLLSAQTFGGSPNVGKGDRKCFDFDSGFGTTESDSFRVNADSATLCLDPDRGGTGGAAVVDIQVCPTSDAASDNTCTDTGLTLNASNPCEAVARGRYRYEVTTAPTGTQDAQIVAEGY